MKWNKSEKLKQMEVYLVGGAVRDSLLGQKVNDQDYVIVNASINQMLELGFQQVGKDFPVFLDPENKEEYALARVERKTGNGYSGFTTVVDGVSLNDDLKRRDLTINAMAIDPSGNLIDPFNGQEDLKNGVLRHVSDAFKEDPLRVLRIARFAAKFNFTIADETMDMMKEMVKNGEIDHLVPERIWKEFTKVCQTEKPSLFFKVLHECGALEKVMPEVDALYGVPQNALYHPEIDTGVHTEMVIDQATKLSNGDTKIIFAALTHDLGKALTPKDQWPKHIDHENLGEEPLKSLSKRLKVPNDHYDLAKLVCVLHLQCHRIMECTPKSIVKLLDKIGAFKSEEKLNNFILACEADKRGRLGLENGDYPQAQYLKDAYDAAKVVSGTPFVEKGLKGLEIKEAVRIERITKVRQHLANKKNKMKI